MPIRSLLLLGATLCAVEAPDPSRFVVAAGQPAELPVMARSGGPLAWELRDATGTSRQRGTATADGSGAATIALTPDAGWHELAFDDGSRLGLVAMDPACGGGSPDPFFAIDSAMEWLVRDDGRRHALARMSRRLGLAMGRERINWRGIQPAPDRFAEAGRSDRLREAWAAAGMPLLEVFHDAPAWAGIASGRYPGDLLGAASAWGRLGGRWRTTAAMEIWNEPDHEGFSGGGAVDHLASLHHAVRYGLLRGSPGLTIGGAVLTGGESRSFRAALWGNGVSRASDFISFHHYGDPRAIEHYVRTLRNELREAGDEAIPLWITESGRPWPVGSDRPALADDAKSGLTIAVRAAESRACGISRHFAFVLPFYVEKQKNFGLTGRDGTPLLGLAAYSHLARRLAGLAYVGDLRIPGALRARAFGDGSRLVAVVWLGDPDRSRRWTPGIPLLAAYGIDGRRLAAAEDGSIPAADGAVVCELPPGTQELVARNTPAAALSALAADGRGRTPAKPTSVVLQMMTVPGLVEPLPRGWRLERRSDGVPFTLRAWNLGDGPALARIRLRPGTGGTIIGEPGRELALPPRSSATVAWLVRPGDGASSPWLVEGAQDDGSQLPPLAVAIADDVNGERLLASLPTGASVPVPAAELAGGDANIAANATRRYEIQGDGSLRMPVHFPRLDDNWAYPRIPAPAALPRSEAILFRLRCARPASIRFFAFEGATGWYTGETLAPADGQWHWVLVRFSDLGHSATTEPDQNGRLDLDRVTHLSIGLNSHERDNLLEIDGCHLLLPSATRP